MQQKADRKKKIPCSVHIPFLLEWVRANSMGNITWRIDTALLKVSTKRGLTTLESGCRGDVLERWAVGIITCMAR